MLSESELGVVGDELHGRGLQVADASIFLTIPATHLQAPAVMVGEWCAQGQDDIGHTCGREPIWRISYHNIWSQFENMRHRQYLALR